MEGHLLDKGMLRLLLDAGKAEGYGYSRFMRYIYEKGSHALLGGMTSAGLSARLMVKLMIPAEKKFPRECEAAREDCMKRIVEFIAEW